VTETPVTYIVQTSVDTSTVTSYSAVTETVTSTITETVLARSGLGGFVKEGRIGRIDPEIIATIAPSRIIH